MRRRKVLFSSNPRRTALKRAGLAVAAALVLLLVVLWFGDDDQPSPLPSESANAVPAQSGMPAQEVETLVPTPDATMASEPAETPAPVPASAENAPAPENATIPEASGSGLTAAAPQEPPKAISAPAKPVSLSDGYFVQLGVFNDTDNAGKLFDNVSSLGLPAHIQSRVVVGPFRNKREAEAARKRLKDIAEGTVLPPQKTAATNEKPKAKSKSRRRSR